MSSSPRAYHGIAIALHWLIALLILALLALGNLMVRLDDADPLRYLLTQWHKSFGVIVLLLVLLRLAWRISHRPPPLPAGLEPWESRAAGAAHLLLYLLMLAIPLSGWIMVSASPLDLPTLLFHGVEWPHLAPFDSLPGKAGISAWFAEVHEVSGWILAALLLAHIGAALRHRFVQGDEVMQRMSPRSADGSWRGGVIPLTMAVTLGVGGMIAYGYSVDRAPPLAAGDASQVTFEFTLQGGASEGAFNESSVELTLDANNPTASRLRAVVNTASVASGNSQIDTTLVGSDWFDSSNHPEAVFESTSLLPDGEDRYRVSGRLQIRGVVQELSFPMQLQQRQDKRLATGSFSVNRLDYGLGADSQADDDTVGFTVSIHFSFELR